MFPAMITHRIETLKLEAVHGSPLRAVHVVTKREDHLMAQQHCIITGTGYIKKSST